MSVNRSITAEEMELEVRVESARAWTPKEKVRFVRQTVAMHRELVAEARWRSAVFTDLYGDALPGCGRECCADGGGGCALSEAIAVRDPLVAELARFMEWDEEQERVVGDRVLPSLDDEALWLEMELRFTLTQVPKFPSSWVEMERQRQRAAPPRPTESVRSAEPERPRTLEDNLERLASLYQRREQLRRATAMADADLVRQIEDTQDSIRTMQPRPQPAIVRDFVDRPG
jgi:hypothetical protein